MAFLSVGLSLLSLHSDFSSGGAVFQVELSAKSCHVSRHFRLESHRVKSRSSLSEKMVSVRKLGCPSYSVRLSSCPSLFLPFVRFSIQSGPNREELRSHGWIEGKECYLRVSPRGFVGDCVTATISWHEAIVLGLCGLFFCIITIFLVYKGNLSSSAIPFFENRRKRNNKNRFVPTSIYPNAPPTFYLQVGVIATQGMPYGSSCDEPHDRGHRMRKTSRKSGSHSRRRRQTSTSTQVCPSFGPAVPVSSPYVR